MTKANLKLKLSMDRWFVVISGLLIVLIIGISIFSIVFLSNHMFMGFSPLEEGEGGIKFNIEEFKSLNLPN
ncbi:MAG: hypothetical protein COT89_01195 [Candidatus Colwellbacteria bacterium CG10_big_fil_rev_8_21_14_0_10_42_22]|uniref:Uncharacterized protein n=1 Tax=Candidatus Colwellbacteria bacterium CG10_big_fil_rev_8_21_14_0_10_42_22 TaxID=1974540 RepID=A0A2H0VFZ8_9BACT|nr:MAG: hypothetical protein COT89_01195 [Candidatus Colwellbacteria bacterium CG10_big_fil_rev_8_21_14_0_10_42_22]